MFLLPFIGSSICDSLVLYLYSTLPNSDPENEIDTGGIYSRISFRFTTLLFWLALTRLVLLLGPLTHYTVTGRRLKWSAAYYILYIGSVFIILAHMLTILVLNPQSLNDIFPLSVSRFFSKPDINDEDDSSTLHRYLLALTYIHRVWAMLTFSLWSIALHIVVVWHVRSTAPESAMMDPDRRDARKRKRMMVYASINKFRNGITGRNWESMEGYNRLEDKQDNVDETTESFDKDDIFSFSDDDTDEGIDLLLPYEETNSREHTLGSDNDIRLEEGLQLKNKKKKKKKTHTNGPVEDENDDDFFSELQSRMKNARLQWSAKLHELQKHMHRNNSNPRLPQNNVVAPKNNFFLHFQLSPFRVLLQLFAYEEVLSNGRLDACFEMDGGEGLTFYVPQLLSFLLHGAYLNAPELEHWILEKCRENIHFAHRCFWFLRAWCLGAGSHHHMLKDDLAPQPEQGDKNNTSLVPKAIGLTPKRFYGSETNLYKHPSTFSSSSAYYNTNTTEKAENERNRNYRSSNSLPDEYSAGNHKGGTGSKFPLEEHRLIEALLLRVIDCGKISAKHLQFGKNREALDPPKESFDEAKECYTMDVNVESGVGTFLASSTQKGYIPVDPTNGFPSVRHLDSYTAKHKYGFMPMNDGASFWLDENYFLSTPRFLDALITIADDLMFAQREKRTKELRKRLKALEVELLPSNVVYLPMKNAHHRVWRIVAGESIALSTKERVPCIVCLEVVDYDSPEITNNEHDPNTQKHKKKEIDVLNEWYKNDRPLQRHNSLLEKVTHYTQKNLKKWRNEIEHASSMNQNESMISDVTNPLLEKDEKEFDTDGVRGSLNDTNDVSSEQSHGGIVFPSIKSTKQSSLLPPLPNSMPRRPSPPPRARTSSYGSSAASSPTNSRSNSPTKNMGQWSSSSSPAFVNSMRKRVKGPIAPNQGLVKLFKPIAPPNTPEQGVQRPPRRGKRDKKLDFDNASSISDNDVFSPSKSADNNPDDERPTIVELSSERNRNPTSNVTHDSVSETMTEIVHTQKQNRSPPVVFKENWSEKEARHRSSSAYGNHPGWRLLPVLLKSNDDLRQEQLASQLIRRMSLILAKSKIPVWLCPYEIIALNDRGGIIEAIPDTISLDSLKRNYPDFTTLFNFFSDYFGPPGTESHDGARANFVESLAAYSIICFLMQIKDRHNGNILLDNKGHIIHIDFGFFFLSSPGKNSGFESAPFKLTSDFVALMDGPFSRTFARFRDLCYRTFLELRKHCYEITLLVEMLMEGNEDLACFRGRPEDAVKELKERFRLDLSDRACLEYVNGLVDESLENWRTTWYDRYQRYCVGVL